jgi:hypothetical protein
VDFQIIGSLRAVETIAAGGPSDSSGGSVGNTAGAMAQAKGGRDGAPS